MPSPPRPPGISILTASAPQSTSWRTHVGPARARVRSSTLNRASGREPLLVMALDDTSQQGAEKRPSPSLARCSLPATWQGHASVGNVSPPRLWAFLSALRAISSGAGVLPLDMTGQSRANLAGVHVGDGLPVAVMGALNVSPESFHRTSVHAIGDDLLAAAVAMVEAGAALIDVGARSTAPYLPN